MEQREKKSSCCGAPIYYRYIDMVRVSDRPRCGKCNELCEIAQAPSPAEPRKETINICSRHGGKRQEGCDACYAELPLKGHSDVLGKVMRLTSECHNAPLLPIDHNLGYPAYFGRCGKCEAIAYAKKIDPIEGHDCDKPGCPLDPKNGEPRKEQPDCIEKCRGCLKKGFDVPLRLNAAKDHFKCPKCGFKIGIEQWNKKNNPSPSTPFDLNGTKAEITKDLERLVGMCRKNERYHGGNAIGIANEGKMIEDTARRLSEREAAISKEAEERGRKQFVEALKNTESHEIWNEATSAALNRAIEAVKGIWEANSELTGKIGATNGWHIGYEAACEKIKEAIAALKTQEETKE